MKDKIIEILQSETWNVTNEAGDLCTVVEEEDFDSIAEKIVKLFAIPVVSGSALEADYWSERCKLAEAIEEENPCDPDVTSDQIKAWSNYHNFIKIKGQRHYR